MFELNPNSDTPLYMQIVEQTKLAIAKGYFRNGDKYPSVRELSRELLINQATVSKAFKELDKQGIIETKAGIGTFISFDDSKISERIKEMSKKLQDDLIEARYLGITLDEIIAMYEKAGDYNDR
ncbi:MULTISPECIES: GntR family transcriptional regulator [Anaerococcus]|uniref:GntR family transcriptional regulator n=1 Tax=Anaerococcus octavius TaxID=54007 RepID=A0A2I1M8W2_9FIRM|nr:MULTISPECIES: GntR family transcriptional regulator [Anaerococcus]MBS6106323.1 GntR family transcriptional regulator [Anaerococcus sp.]MDU0894657.1 GntR family transcriptional regulator [Anaerococcus sp.]MDU2599092.1 GntR family transcriptional regulator [Anaerococcus sp.]MDU3176982.1 GntR family transcriptional regulator [Anaerococcus sp.]MDU4026131.1 GntR family transcriptional regulator [Anaerococcus sp.]